MFAHKRQSRAARQPTIAWVLNHSIAGSLHSPARIEPARALQEHGWRVRLYAVGTKGDTVIDGVPLMEVALPDVYLLGQAAYHLRVIRHLLRDWSSLDVIFFHQISALWLMPLKLLRLLRGGKGPRLVLDVRDLNVIEGSLRNRIRITFYNLIQAVANRWVDGETAITARMAELVGIPAQKLWGIWPSGVNLDRFLPAQDGRSWPQDAEPVHLIYIGKLHPERNLMLLCRAIEQAHAAGMAFQFTLVGSGPEQEALAAFAAETNGRIRVLPPVPYQQVPDLLRKVHVGVTSLPAADNVKYAASSPIKLFEYLAAGMPILSTRNPCHTDVVAGRDLAFWADDATETAVQAALVDLWRRRAALAQMGAAAADAAQAHSWHASGEWLAEALRQGLSQIDAPTAAAPAPVRKDAVSN